MKTLLRFFYLNLFAVLWVSSFLSSTSFAALSCQVALFQEKKVSDLEKKVVLSLQDHGFIVSNNVVYRKKGASKVRVGKLETIEARYLFEWQDREYHDDWVAQGKVTKAEMDYILKQNGQVYGRGFYVSLHPADSKSYGSHLTVFELERPLIMLAEFNQNEFGNSELVLNQLRAAGVSGNRCGSHKTWLNVFNENVLKNAKSINQEIFNSFFDLDNRVPLDKISELFKKTSVSAVVTSSQLKFDDVLLRLRTQDQASSFEKAALVSAFIAQPSAFLEKITGHPREIEILRIALQYSSLAQVGKVLYFSSSVTQKKVISLLQNKINQIPELKYFFTFYDLFDVATSQSIGRRNQADLGQMFQVSQQHQTSLEQTDLAKVKDADDFKLVLSQVLNSDVKIRDSSEPVLSPLANKKGLTLTPYNFDLIKNNKLLEIKKSTSYSNGNKEVEIEYFSALQIFKVAHLLEGDVVSKIVLLTQRQSSESLKKANELANEAIFALFFDETKFGKISSLVNEPKVSALSLYKAFLSLHPLSRFNQEAAQIYYMWLVKNYFVNEPLQPRSFTQQSDLFTPSEYTQKNFHIISQLMMKLWVFSAADQKTFLKRAKQALSNESNFQRALSGILDMDQLLNASQVQK